MAPLLLSPSVQPTLWSYQDYGNTEIAHGKNHRVQKGIAASVTPRNMPASYMDPRQHTIMMPGRQRRMTSAQAGNRATRKAGVHVRGWARSEQLDPGRRDSLGSDSRGSLAIDSDSQDSFDSDIAGIWGDASVGPGPTGLGPRRARAAGGWVG